MCIFSCFFSPTAGPCCNADCKKVPASENLKCRSADSCNNASFCDGLSAACPAAAPKENYTECNNFTQVCISGVREHCLMCSELLFAKSGLCDELVKQWSPYFIQAVRCHHTEWTVYSCFCRSATYLFATKLAGLNAIWNPTRTKNLPQERKSS